MAALERFLTFDAEFAGTPVQDDDADVPPGRELMEFVAQALRTRGLPNAGVYQHDAYGWSFDTTLDGVSVWCMLQRSDNWLLISRPQVPLLKRLFAKGDAGDAHQQVCAAIDAVLHGDPRFSNVRWFTQAEFHSHGPARLRVDCGANRTVNPFTVASITCLCAFGGALVGSVIRSRLPPQHLSKESQDVMRLGMGLVATMTALLLGLVTASARSTFDSQDSAVRNSAASLLSLDRLLARYGPETAPTRALLKEALQARIEATWPEGRLRGAGFTQTDATPMLEIIEGQILALPVTNDNQRWYRGEALKLGEEVLKTRWRVLGSQGGTVPVIFLVIVIFWLTVTFGTFGLYAPPNLSVISVLLLASLSVAAAVFLILELDGPFEGWIRVSSEPFRYAVTQLGR